MSGERVVLDGDTDGNAARLVRATAGLADAGGVGRLGRSTGLAKIGLHAGTMTLLRLHLRHQLTTGELER